MKKHCLFTSLSFSSSFSSDSGGGFSLSIKVSLAVDFTIFTFTVWYLCRVADVHPEYVFTLLYFTPSYRCKSGFHIFLKTQNTLSVHSYFWIRVFPSTLQSGGFTSPFFVGSLSAFRMRKSPT